jgi:hypothetical protein
VPGVIAAELAVNEKEVVLPLKLLDMSSHKLYLPTTGDCPKYAI